MTDDILERIERNPLRGQHRTSRRFKPVAALFKTDAYKLGHINQYRISGNITLVYSNYTNRGSMIEGLTHVVHFGLQAYIQKSLVDDFAQFFAADEDRVCQLYHERVTMILGEDAANQIGTDHIRALHRKGYLPLKFCALPEGTLVPLKVPSFTIENTDPEFFWLVNYIETGLSVGVWQPSTSATIAYRFRALLDAQAERSGAVGEDPEAVDFQCHDFSYRGMSSHESAAASAAGHLLSFKGSDSLVAMDWIDEFYGGEYEVKSIPATEHSVMSAGIASMGEQATFNALLDLYPTGNVAIVSDTFDLWKVCTEILPFLKDKIMQRDGKLIVRPDSGDPELILCGDPKATPNSPAWYGVVRLLAELFGTTRNAKGYKHLDKHIGTIYGDSITYKRAMRITNTLILMGFASTVVTLGIGSFTYQLVTRDTVGKSAMKATYAIINGLPTNLFKNPITDNGTKKSATGRLAVLKSESTGDLWLEEKVAPELEKHSVLQPVWVNGEFVQWQTFDDVRLRLASMPVYDDVYVVSA